MDTTETYIKMCDCPEIQEQWKRNTGDWAINFHCHSNFHATAVRIPYIVTGQTWDKDIWLPRQDQLQEMVFDGCSSLEQLESIYGWACKECGGHDVPINYERLDKFTSMEQLWLAFYMEDKHNKVWDGQKWQHVIKSQDKNLRG